MAFYDISCPKCCNISEVELSINDYDPMKLICPKCGTVGRKLISNIGISFAKAGKGIYVNDYKK